MENGSGVQVQPVDNERVEDNDANLSWMQFHRKHRPQLFAMLPAMILLLTGGINLSIGIYETRVMEEDTSIHFLISWFVGAAIGSFVGSVLVRHSRRNVIVYTGGTLSIISGIIFVIFAKSEAGVTVGKYLSGAAYGLVFVYALIHTAEISHKKLRGYHLSNINLCITHGILLSGILHVINKDIILPNHCTGIAFVIVGIVSLACTYFTNYDCAIDLVDWGKDDQALSVIMNLQSEPPNSVKIQEELEEVKDMINEDRRESKSIISDGNWRALVRVLLVRTFMAFSMSIFVSKSNAVIDSEVLGERFSLTLLVFFRWLGEIVNCIFLIDKVGRRKPLYLSVSSSTLSLFFISLILLLLGLKSILVWVLSILCWIYQFSFGIGVSNTSLVYLSEAFPLRKKAFSVLLITFMENFVHIIMIVIFNEIIDSEGNIPYAVFYITFVIHLIFMPIFYFIMPETAGLSLRECKNVMKSPLKVSK